MRKFLFLFILATSSSFAQDYVDILRMSYGASLGNTFEGSDESTDIGTLDAGLTIPLPLSEQQAFITGFDFSWNQLRLKPRGSITNLLSSTLKIGLASTYNDRWSSTVVFLPKISSDHRGLSGKDFFFGGFAVAKLQKTEHLKYRFGLYASTEAFGFFATPIIGWYYLSPNGKFEMDTSLPISADINYKINQLSIGVDYFGIGRGYNMDDFPDSATYVQQSSLDFGTYVQWNGLDNSVLLRGKIGYTSSDFELYTQGDTYDFGLSAFRFGDDRRQLNPDINGGIFIKFEAIYRFHLKKDTQ